MKSRVWILVATLLVAVVIVFLFPAIPQSQAYHNFADTRMFVGIPNSLNVLSNVFFLLVGILGMEFVLRGAAENRSPFLDSGERWPYFAVFVGITLTAFGSSYYHFRPNDNTLVWDRIPMTIGFLALVAATLSERINVKLGVRLIFPLMALGVSSVTYWHFTQTRGHGDLRPYAIAQFGSLLVLLLLITLLSPRYTRTSDLAVSLAIYALAKVFEAADRPIFSLGGVVSGHTLKHLAAAASAYWILRMLRLRVPVTSEQ